jgi:hypothetical protein
MLFDRFAHGGCVTLGQPFHVSGAARAGQFCDMRPILGTNNQYGLAAPTLLAEAHLDLDAD